MYNGNAYGNACGTWNWNTPRSSGGAIVCVTSPEIRKQDCPRAIWRARPHRALGLQLLWPSLAWQPPKLGLDSLRKLHDYAGARPDSSSHRSHWEAKKKIGTHLKLQDLYEASNNLTPRQQQHLEALKKWSKNFTVKIIVVIDTYLTRYCRSIFCKTS